MLFRFPNAFSPDDGHKKSETGSGENKPKTKYVMHGSNVASALELEVSLIGVGGDPSQTDAWSMAI